MNIIEVIEICFYTIIFWWTFEVYYLFYIALTTDELI